VADSRLEYVSGLGKRELQLEIFRLDLEVKQLNASIVSQRVESEKLADMLAETIKRDSARLDAMMDKQHQILDVRLGLGVEPAKQTSEPTRPLGRNRNWQADYEKKRREDHWRKVIDEQEKVEKPVAPTEDAKEAAK
jgi:hypothetical protein